jgi:hypothetical protein
MENLQKTARHKDSCQKKQGRTGTEQRNRGPEYRDHHASHCQGVMQKARRGFPPGLP